MPIQKLSPNFEASVGVEANAYQYNGIERVEDFGLEVSHAQFRTLDAQTGRWWQIDPMAEFAPAWTPYRFAFDNPIAYIDPLGLFETRKEARRYRREHDTGGKIVKSRENGKKTFSIETETQYARESGGSLETQTVRTSISKDAESGQIMEGPIISDNSGWQSFQPVSGAIDNDYTLEAFAIPLGKLIPKGMGRFGKSANFADEGVGGAVKGETKLISQFSTRTIDDAVGLVMRNSNDIRHIFAAKHNLGPLVNRLGGQESTIRAVLNAANGKLPASGVFNNIPVNVGGQTVFIRGSVVNGIPRIGTMFIP
ncbi:MAG TPA: RHS repeat-associated core domain-containing protein [Chitinophagales bacterium]|nr:RHS repeat-associated core domain-containing protein [Chitinophagales bacterium]